MSKESVTLKDIYENEACEGSVFKAVVMMSQEARYINEQSKVGNIELTMKPTTIAMHKFKENKLVVDIIEPEEETPTETNLFAPTAEKDISVDMGGDIFAETVAEIGEAEAPAQESSIEE